MPDAEDEVVVEAIAEDVLDAEGAGSAAAEAAAGDAPGAVPRAAPGEAAADKPGAEARRGGVLGLGQMRQRRRASSPNRCAELWTPRRPGPHPTPQMAAKGHADAAAAQREDALEFTASSSTTATPTTAKSRASSVEESGGRRGHGASAASDTLRRRRPRPAARPRPPAAPRAGTSAARGSASGSRITKATRSPRNPRSAKSPRSTRPCSGRRGPRSELAALQRAVRERGTRSPRWTRPCSEGRCPRSRTTQTCTDRRATDPTPLLVEDGDTSDTRGWARNTGGPPLAEEGGNHAQMDAPVARAAKRRKQQGAGAGKSGLACEA